MNNFISCNECLLLLNINDRDNLQAQKILLAYRVNKFALKLSVLEDNIQSLKLN
jgi:hypothetical protein